MEIKQTKVSILEMARGALEEEVNSQLGRIAENILDLNTDHKKARQMVITIDFATDETREIVSVRATTKVKLIHSKPVVSQITFGADRNGEMCAVELTKQHPGQFDLTGSEQPENTVFVVTGGKKASGQE